MALITCAECGKEISDTAPACIGCGAPIVKAAQAALPDIKPTEDGRWTCGGYFFRTLQQAELFRQGKQTPPATERPPAPPNWEPLGKYEGSYEPPPETSKTGTPGWAYALATVIVLAVVASCMGKNSGKESKSTMSASAALGDCRYALQRLTKDPEKTEVPYVAASENSESYTFTWNRDSKLIRARNGFGIEIGLPGHCKVNKHTQKIVSIGIENVSIER